jgi:multiple sugar transport system substrate-binding protein
MNRAALRPVFVAITAMSLLALTGCGGGAAADSTPTLHWYTAPQNGGSFAAAAAQCTDAAHGRYRISVEPLPADSSQQREQLVRRLAAEDGDIDLISMDVVWTAEFAEAGWVRPWPKDRAAAVSAGVIPSVLETGRYKGRMYASPLNTGSQVLFYRKDLVKTPPKTWDEMLAMAAKLPANERKVQVQGARYEGYTVWFNSLLASAGGSILDDHGRVSLATGPTRKALDVMHNLATSSSADPSMSNNMEDQARIAYQSGDSPFMVNYANLLTSIKAEKPDIYKKTALAAFPGVTPGQPAHVTLGGFNVGVGSYGSHPNLAFDAAQCLGAPAQQRLYVKQDGLPPVSEALYQDPQILKIYPSAPLLLETFRNGSTRPISPAYNDISLAVQRALHPASSINPRDAVGSLRSSVDDAIHSRGLL